MKTLFTDISSAYLDKWTGPYITVGLDINKSASSGATVKYFSGQFKRQPAPDASSFQKIRPILRPGHRLDNRFGVFLFFGNQFTQMPVASSYYIQTASIAPVIHWLWMPIGFSIFNVILLNEFPDYEADIVTGKKNLLVRIGKQKGKIVYIIFNLFTCLTMLISPCFGIPFQVIYFYLPFVAVALFIVYQVLKNRHEDARWLKILCGLNIAVNLGTSLAFILAYV